MALLLPARKSAGGKGGNALPGAGSGAAGRRQWTRGERLWDQHIFHVKSL